MRLHGYWRSPATHRVRIALEWKGLDHATEAVDLRRGEHRRLTFLNRNPMGLVPVLEDGPVTLTQSLAICEYLEERHPEPPLLPGDAVARARVRGLAHLICGDLHPLGTPRVLMHVSGACGLSETAWYRHWVLQGLAAVEAQIGDVAGDFACGDEVTLADVCLVPLLHHARRHGCDLGPFPKARRIEAACLEMCAFDRARPERQPEAETARPPRELAMV